MAYMKKLVICTIIIIVGYFAWLGLVRDNSLEALYDKPYIVVYGKDSCGWTNHYLKEFKNEGINVIYKSVVSREVCDELHPRMEKAGLETRRYNLPVIDVNTKLFIRPEFESILDTYENYEKG